MMLGFFRCSCSPMVVWVPYGWVGVRSFQRAANSLVLSLAMEMFFSSYTASSSVWKPRITMFWNRSLCTFAQFSISLFGMFST